MGLSLSRLLTDSDALSFAQVFEEPPGKNRSDYDGGCVEVDPLDPDGRGDKGGHGAVAEGSSCPNCNKKEDTIPCLLVFTERARGTPRGRTSLRPRTVLVWRAETAGMPRADQVGEAGR